VFSVTKRLNSHKYDLILGTKVGSCSRTQHEAFCTQSGVASNNTSTSTNTNINTNTNTTIVVVPDNFTAGSDTYKIP